MTEEQIKKLVEHVKELTRFVNELETKAADEARAVDERFTELEERVDMIEYIVGAQWAGGKLESRIATLERKFGPAPRLEQRVEALEKVEDPNPFNIKPL